MRDYPISAKRQKLLDEVNNAPLKVGDVIYVQDGALNNYGKTKGREFGKDCIIVEMDGDSIKVKQKDDSVRKEFYTIEMDDILSRAVGRIGENPFNEKFNSIRSVNFSFDSILFNLDILGNKKNINEKFKMGDITLEELNWNPFIYDKDGNKKHYQRDFVWSIPDKQLLIESIYQGIECGRILIRKRGWKELEELAKNGETDLCFNDLVDGKQRLNAVRGFILEEFPDAHGNYFGDLSYNSQRMLTNHQLFSYSEMPERTTDEEVLYQFLKLNHAGVPQSIEHINHVKSLLKSVKQ